MTDTEKLKRLRIAVSGLRQDVNDRLRIANREILADPPEWEQAMSFAWMLDRIDTLMREQGGEPMTDKPESDPPPALTAEERWRKLCRDYGRDYWFDPSEYGRAEARMRELVIVTIREGQAAMRERCAKVDVPMPSTPAAENIDYRMGWQHGAADVRAAIHTLEIE